MKFFPRIFALLLTLIISSAAFADPCGKSGMTALRDDNESRFMFFVFREGPDIFFDVPGKQISFPSGTDGPRRFLIDGVLYESLMVKTKEFVGEDKGLTDLDILKRHQSYESAYIKTTPSPLKEFAILGPRTKQATGKQPSFTFYLWLARNPKDEKGARQYFLTTVSNGEVVVITAIVPNEALNDLAMETFHAYAASFQHVLNKDDCPTK